MTSRTLAPFVFIVTFLFSFLPLNGQISLNEITGGNSNTISTAVPFITITPDVRSAGMGDVGVASSPDINSQHWNVAKYAFIEGKGGVSLTLSPWLRKIIPDINLLYLSEYYKINDWSTFSASMRYFSLGSIHFASVTGLTSSYTPYEMTIDAGYSMKLTENFSGGAVIRYIYSNLGSFNDVFPGTSVAGDLGLYYQSKLWIAEKDASWAIGLNISNVGSPISYTSDAHKVRIPTNFRIGSRLSYNIDYVHSISFMADANKLMVPTNPILGIDSVTATSVVLFGYEEPESIVAGMFQSFYDAPGYMLPDGSRSVLLEELYEIMLSIGAEYWYRDQLALRAGYFHENAYKGGRQYFTVGFGIKRKFVTFDAAYLMPRLGNQSPLANTIRVMLSFEI